MSISQKTKELLALKPKSFDEGWRSKVKMKKIEGGTSETARFVDGVLPFGMHSLESKLGKFMPLYCPDFDPETEELRTPGTCPVCAAGHRVSSRYLTLAFWPSDSALLVYEAPVSVVTGLIALKDKNDGHSPMHPDHGCTVQISKSGTGKETAYNVTYLKQSPLTPSQRALPLPDLAAIYQPDSVENLQRALSRAK